jgi:hypothetical protein
VNVAELIRGGLGLAVAVSVRPPTGGSALLCGPGVPGPLLVHEVAWSIPDRTLAVFELLASPVAVRISAPFGQEIRHGLDKILELEPFLPDLSASAVEPSGLTRRQRTFVGRVVPWKQVFLGVHVRMYQWWVTQPVQVIFSCVRLEEEKGIDFYAVDPARLVGLVKSPARLAPEMVLAEEWRRVREYQMRLRIRSAEYPW